MVLRDNKWTSRSSSPDCVRTKRPCGAGRDARRPVRFARPGDDRPGGDIDVMIEIEPLDVVDRAALNPYVRPPAESEAANGF